MLNKGETLIAHVDTLAMAQRLAVFNADARRRARSGPDHWCCRRRRHVRSPISPRPASTASPACPPISCGGVAAALGKPVVAPSANHSGHVSPTAADHIRADLRGRVNIIMDGGHTEVGVESIIIDCFGAPTLLRPGGLPREAIEEVLGPPFENREAPALSGADDAPAALSMLESHYVPHAQLRMNAASAAAGEALLAFGPDVPNVVFAEGTCLNCSASSDLVEAAVNLFSHLRALESSGAAAIAVMPVPEQGLGEAINDRLRRAAAPREIR